MRTSKWIRVRPLEVSDFRFIRRLASKQENFTVPPFYVLWLLKETNGQCCLVAQHAKLGPVAYLLSILVTARRRKVLYVWQLAASKRGLELGATEVLLLTLRAFMRRTRVQKVFFTADPESAQFRAIRKYAYALYGAGLRHRRPLPSSVSRSEREFVVRVT
jgi:hypothetical protein